MTIIGLLLLFEKIEIILKNSKNKIKNVTLKNR